MSNGEGTIYVATMAVSGLSIPPHRVLDLGNSKVLLNQEIKFYESSTNPYSNVILPGSGPPSSRQVTRFVVIREAPDSALEIPLPSVQAKMEFSILPLRLATPASVYLDALWFRPGTEADGMQLGLDQPALEPSGENFFVELDDDLCDCIERALPFLRYRKAFADPIDRFTSALMRADRIESALHLLVAMELLVDSGGRQRGRAARVAKRAASFASSDPEEQREYRKLLELAFKYRTSIWHGEGDAQLVTEAQQWLNNHYPQVRLVSSLALQRALGNLRHIHGCPWDNLVVQIDQGDRDALEYIYHLPRVYFGQGYTTYNLDPRKFTAAGGGSTKIIPGKL